ncbi:uncharacterized protein [Gossypium hirsutum]|uniref:Uncharacterized protein LOC107946050 n=1 Tax=Gossypium hirsutum TaxID=3635 RepID=A0A1U8N9R2_GOSHI|nr:uncharacterized protein LOC107946050 [Gossypium hirsutum]XP_016735720.1 uncharacterized protein LOC107946050 [Gossypium hirsutum]XP_040962760.1 uncharacterized protein LOC107946050 [Gossypium hirsutum]XP_040962761.1 uncharacterized protein LOC107946050 [Gossypium hirsutum]XP_040962762.1 uncharacterized protein LOC107946050 [Gossypium hirsutum]
MPYGKKCVPYGNRHRFQLMDVKNDYFLAKFESMEDYTNILSKGQWVIFGHYLIVQPRFPSFTTLQSYLHKVVAWICIPGLSGTLYKKSILHEIGEMIDTFIKIDLQIDKGSRGQFAGFVVHVNLLKPLVLKIRIAKRIHRVKYESLPIICYHCGTYGHLKDKCLQNKNGEAMDEKISGDKQHFYEELNLIVVYHLSTSVNHGNNQVHGNNHDYQLDCFHDPLGLVLE